MGWRARGGREDADAWVVFVTSPRPTAPPPPRMLPALLLPIPAARPTLPPPPQGQGLGNAFLSHISAVDGIFHVCRGFDDADVVHVEDRVDPVEGALPLRPCCLRRSPRPRPPLRPRCVLFAACANAAVLRRFMPFFLLLLLQTSTSSTLSCGPKTLSRWAPGRRLGGGLPAPSACLLPRRGTPLWPPAVPCSLPCSSRLLPPPQPTLTCLPHTPSYNTLQVGKIIEAFKKSRQTMTKEQKDELVMAEKALAWLEVGAGGRRVFAALHCLPAAAPAVHRGHFVSVARPRGGIA